MKTLFLISTSSAVEGLGCSQLYESRTQMNKYIELLSDKIYDVVIDKNTFTFKTKIPVSGLEEGQEYAEGNGVIMDVPEDFQN